MLTKRQNLLETIHGGTPDRFVNQFEAFAIIRNSPYMIHNAAPVKGGPQVVNAWGVTLEFPEGTPGAFPVHNKDTIVCKDITHWRDYVRAPKVHYDESDWKPFVEQANAVDRKEQFVTGMVFPGIFEQSHYLLEIQNCLMAFYEEPECLKELIDYIADWELAYAKELCDHYHIDALFHHDDWGTQRSTFMSVDMFREFLLPAYKAVYGYYKERGVEVIVHHSDSYAATLVPSMIEMQMDIWQGVMVSNNIPELIKQYGGQISFMGGIDSASVDHPGWTQEEVAKEVERATKECGKHYFIPCASQGGAMSTFPGVYQALTEEIDRQSKLQF